jgi:hypothetical protein
MSYRSERFQNGFLSLDSIKDGDNPEKREIVSDHGEGARQIFTAAEWAAVPESEPCQATRAEKLAEARRRLVEAGLARLLPVLDQVVANGKNRRESIFRLGKIWQTKLVAARRRYYRGTEMLLTFFSPNEIKG